MFKSLQSILILHFTLSLQSAFYTQSAFYPWSTVCSLQSAVCSPQSSFYTDRLICMNAWNRLICMVKTIGPQAAFYADRNNASSYCLPLCRVLYTVFSFFGIGEFALRQIVDLKILYWSGSFGCSVYGTVFNITQCDIHLWSDGLICKI